MASEALAGRTQQRGWEAVPGSWGEHRSSAEGRAPLPSWFLARSQTPCGQCSSEPSARHVLPTAITSSSSSFRAGGPSHLRWLVPSLQLATPGFKLTARAPWSAHSIDSASRAHRSSPLRELSPEHRCSQCPSVLGLHVCLGALCVQQSLQPRSGL